MPFEIVGEITEVETIRWCLVARCPASDVGATLRSFRHALPDTPIGRIGQNVVAFAGGLEPPALDLAPVGMASAIDPAGGYRRAVAALLRWAQTQPWGAAWRATFPVAGVDGTLARRFRGTPLEGRLFAKTGTLNATNALSGYLTARSGRTLVFSFYANDVPGDVSATEWMDRTLNLIAAEN